MKDETIRFFRAQSSRLCTLARTLSDQMKERTRGKANARRINENHPRLRRAQIKRILGGGD